MSAAPASEGDLGASDEVKSFHHEGDGEENLQHSLGELHDLKQELEQEADTEKAKQPSVPKIGSSALGMPLNGSATAVQLPMFPKVAYSNGQPVQFMLPAGLPGFVPNGAFPSTAFSTATIATSMPGSIKMEFPPNGSAAVSGAPGMVLPGYAANLAMAHAYPYMLTGQYMVPQVLPVAGPNGCSPNVIMSQQGLVQQPAKEKKQHVKKPLNAFMLFMKEKRQDVIKECTLKESAAINQILGKMWHKLDKTEQAKYYELARQERAKHMQMYPGWSARDNYALHKKRKRRKTPKEEEEMAASGSRPPLLMENVVLSTPSYEDGEAESDPNGKKCRARYGTDKKFLWCDPCKRKKRCIKYSDDDDDDTNADTPTSPLSSKSIVKDTDATTSAGATDAHAALPDASSSSVVTAVPVVESVEEKSNTPLPQEDTDA